MFHPWRSLRARSEVLVEWERMPGRLGETDGERVIVLHPDQSQVQRRCTLAHELAHIELGHVGGASPAEERHAAGLAARWLIPLDRLIDAARWSGDLEEIADELWVDLPTLLARLDGLSAGEKRRLSTQQEEADRGA